MPLVKRLAAATLVYKLATAFCFCRTKLAFPFSLKDADWSCHIVTSRKQISLVFFLMQGLQICLKKVTFLTPRGTNSSKTRDKHLKQAAKIHMATTFYNLWSGTKFSFRIALSLLSLLPWQVMILRFRVNTDKEKQNAGGKRLVTYNQHTRWSYFADCVCTATCAAQRNKTRCHMQRGEAS